MEIQWGPQSTTMEFLQIEVFHVKIIITLLLIIYIQATHWPGNNVKKSTNKETKWLVVLSVIKK